MTWTLLFVSLLYVALNALIVRMDVKDHLTKKEKEVLLDEFSTMKTLIDGEPVQDEPATEVSTASLDESCSSGSGTDSPVDYRACVRTLLEQLDQSIEEEDLPDFCRQMTAFFEAQETKPYYLKLDLSDETEDVRTVLIGDTHCDPVSLKGILAKLLYSDYDYFSRGRLVFLGDYLDRGGIFFEYTRLLVGLKTLMGERCILMKGNHELIEYDPYSARLDSMVYPSDTCPLLNKYCGDYKDFLSKFAIYFSGLPYYLLIKTRRGTDLLVHGGIPRDRYLESCLISSDTGEMTLTDPSIRLDSILDNMIWSDPSPAPFKVQGPSSRFSFGRDQFVAFMDANRLNRLFRSHEPVENGVESFYDGRLYTIFSNGGAENEYTGYPDVLNPVFGILSAEGDIRFESIFLKRVCLHAGASVFETVLYMEKEAGKEILDLDDLHLNPEFFVEKQV